MENQFSNQSLIDTYENALQPVRDQALNSDIAERILDYSLDRDTVHLFWIFYNVLGVNMTEPVEDWICRAGEASIAKGYEILGKDLLKHARHEAGHQKMMQRDYANLIDLWNATHDEKISLSHFDGNTRPRVVREYEDIHEENIVGPTPYCQVAIQYEIESLAPILGPKLIQYTRDICGEDVLSKLSFITDHVEIDIAHTEFNKQVLSKFLKDFPETIEPLIEVGTESSTIYMRFFDYCMQQAKDLKTSLMKEPEPA
ncbi:hypothetical protein [Aurantivibrio plasticivorans]